MPTIAETAESVTCLPNWKVYELQTWYIVGARGPVSPTSAMISKVKGQGRDVMWCWPISREGKSQRSTKIGTKTAHSMGNNAHQFQGQKVKGQGH